MVVIIWRTSIVQKVPVHLYFILFISLTLIRESLFASFYVSPVFFFFLYFQVIRVAISRATEITPVRVKCVDHGRPVTAVSRGITLHRSIHSPIIITATINCNRRGICRVIRICSKTITISAGWYVYFVCCLMWSLMSASLEINI